MLCRELQEGFPVRVEEALDDHGLGTGPCHCRKGAFEITGTVDHYRLKLQASSRSGRLEIIDERSAERVGGRGRCENRDARQARNEIAENFQALAANLRIHG